MYLEGSWFLFAFIFTAVISLVYDRITHNKAPKDAPYLPLPRSWLTGMPASYGEYIEHGYQTHPEKMFSVPTDSGPLIILPRKWIDFIKVLHDEICSFRSAFKFWFLHEHTRIGGDDIHQNALKNAARLHLTKHADLEKLLHGAKEELDIALLKELPDCQGWTDIAIYPKVIHIVARLVARVFVGPELCRNQEYLDVSVMFAANCLIVSRILAWCPPLLRPAVKYVTPGYFGLRRQEAQMRRLLMPLITQRRQTVAAGRAKTPDDLLHWFMDGSSQAEKNDPEFLALSLINACLAAIHSTAIVATNAILDLATRPQLMDPLRRELITLCDQEGNLVLDMTLLKLPILDSFLKESQRFHPFGLIGILRMSESEIVLPDGAIIPRNSQFAFASNSMSMDTRLWDEVEKFDLFRFERLSSQVKDPKSNSWQFVSSNDRSYNFGAGLHLCPGRLFAAMELKVIMATILTRYDLKAESVTGYQSGARGLMFIPDPRTKISMRRRVAPTNA